MGDMYSVLMLCPVMGSFTPQHNLLGRFYYCPYFTNQGGDLEEAGT